MLTQSIAECSALKWEECMSLLELGESASRDEIKRAYRRLAYEYHPDHAGRDAGTQRKFVAITQAYRQVIQASRAVDQGRPIGTCWNCREFGAVIEGLDGHARCDDCALRSRYSGRLLPLPKIVMVRCTLTIILMLVSAVLLLVAPHHHSTVSALLGVLFGVASLITLALTCVSVVHCVERRR
jgi:hypothetical protein